MNLARIAILGVAVVAAGAAAFLARDLLGGGTEKVEASAPPPPPVTQVLVAASDIDPGRALTVQAVRWQEWPESALAPAFITQKSVPDVDKAVEGAVVRTRIVAGEPITEAKIVRTDKAGFLAAMIDPGKRAVSIGITAESGAGGFILPNDRVDVILTERRGDRGDAAFQTRTILRDVRVLAIDQVFKEEADRQVVVGKTATLELAPEQAEVVSLAQASGTLSLALRGLGDTATADDVLARERARKNHRGTVSLIRYGHTVAAAPLVSGEEK